MTNRYRRGMLWVVVVLPAYFSSCATHPARTDRDPAWATPVAARHVENFYRIDSTLYRSSQPSREGFRELWGLGIHEALNLRTHWNDRCRSRGMDFALYHIKMRANRSDTDQFVEALRIIRDRRSPMVIHCWHGSDRTGIVTALYRMVFQDWSRERAIEELQWGGYGYHTVFGNIIAYLETVDVEALKKAVFDTPGTE